MANPIVTSLPAYVEANKEELLLKILSGADSVKNFRTQTGVVGTTAISLLNTAVSFGDGKGCGWTDAGTSTITQRNIVPGDIKINQSFCDHELINTYAESLLKIAAGRETLPFEAQFAQGVINGVTEALDTAIWQGDTSSSAANLNKFDGLLKILGAESDVVKVSRETSIIDTVNAVAEGMPARTFAKGGVIFMGLDDFKSYTLALANSNLFNYPVTAGTDVIIPGTNIKAVGVLGLVGTSSLVGGDANNFVFGTDIQGSQEIFKLWYSDDNQEFRLAIKFTAGVQVAFPDEVVVSAAATA